MANRYAPISIVERQPLRIFTLMLTAALIATPATAQKRKDKNAAPSPPTLFAAPVSLMIAGFDSDGDAVVSRAEYDVGVARSFGAGDSDSNGKITLIELSRWAQTWLGNPGAVPGQYDFDRDGDDAVSKEEFTGEFARRFAALDKDGDGLLQRSELIIFMLPRIDGKRGPAPAAEAPPPR